MCICSYKRVSISVICPLLLQSPTLHLSPLRKVPRAGGEAWGGWAGCRMEDKQESKKKNTLRREVLRMPAYDSSPDKVNCI